MRLYEEKQNTRKIITIVLLTAVALLLGQNLFAKDLKLIKEKSVAISPGQLLRVEASGADVKVKTWDKNEAYIKIFGNSRAEDKMEFRIEQTSEGVKVTAKKEGSSFFNWFGGGISVRIEATVPAQFNTAIETSGGDIDLADLKGEFDLHTSGGDVSLQNTVGKCGVQTSGGDITLKNHSGNTGLETSGGDIKCISTSGDLSAHTSGGDIDVNVSNGKVSVETSGGDIILNYSGDNKGIEAYTSGGDIQLTVPKTIKASVNFKTSGGEIDSEFSTSRVGKVSRGTLNGDFNGGGPSIKCKTTGGDITILEK